MLVVVIHKELINETLNFVNLKKILEEWLNLATEKFIAHIRLKMCWVTFFYLFYFKLVFT